MLQLIAVHAAIVFEPSVVGLRRDANLTNRLLNRLALTLQHLNLPKLQNNVFRLLSLCSCLLVLSKNGIIPSQLVDHFSEGAPMGEPQKIGRGCVAKP